MRPLPLHQQQPTGLRRVLRTTTTTVAPPRPPRLSPPRATEGQGASNGSADNAPDSVVRTATTPPARPPTSFATGPQLDKAARRFAAGVKAGLTADEMVAMEIGGVPNFADLTPPQREYASAVKRKLEKRAEELAKEEAERRAREARNFELGKALYERGEYRACVEALEQGVEDAGGRGTQLGGECAMWLALGYQALGREEQCLELYRWLEQNHPNKKLRKQAADLRYILEAPKLELSPEERVTVPLISSDDAWRQGGRRSSAASSLRKRGGGGGAGKGERKPWERDLDVELQFLPDKWYVRVAWVAVLVGSGVYGNWVAKQQQPQLKGGPTAAVVVEQRTEQQQALSSLPVAPAPVLRAR
jgi:tetratricopeptide (TPR) repeat protein